MAWVYIPQEHLITAFQETEKMPPDPTPSSPSVPGSAGSTSASIWRFRTLARYVTWRGKHLPVRSWRRALKTAPWMMRLNGLILPVLMADRGAALFRASLAETPASPTASPENVLVPMMTASSSSSLFGSRRKCGLAVFSGKMSPAMRTDSLPPLFRSWKGWVTGLRQEYSQRPKWGPLTGASACSSWPIVRTSDMNGPGTHGTGGLDLRTTASQWEMSSMAASAFITPAASDATPGGVITEKMSGASLTQQVNGLTKAPEPAVRKTGGGAGVGRKAPDGGKKNWATPRANDPEKRGQVSADPRNGLPGQTQNSWSTPSAHDGRRPGLDMKSTQGRNLSREVGQLAGVPVAASKKWPTAAARDHKGAPAMLERADGRSRMDQLDRVAERGFPFSPPDPAHQNGETSSPPRRRLNPQFVEFLMGWPAGWTDFAPLETAWCRWQQLARGCLYQLIFRKGEK